MIRNYNCGLVSLPNDKNPKGNILRFINMSKNKMLYYAEIVYFIKKV